MKRGHGRLMIAVMALVMASLACSVRMEGPTPTPSMTVAPTISPSMTATFSPSQCLVVRALAGGGGALNLRVGPGTSYAVITTLHDGQILVMDGVYGEWFGVRVVMDGNTKSGFVHSSYVEACP
ncbi:MAG TPA: SH3 domain-containing protein [Candidatus Hydrogenedentes bacterium]|nr:SH3 domain-containing protein [Candidatus Hydrogenedentota bacterium]